jgi:F0F1-type ATP synthase assembly protein I
LTFFVFCEIIDVDIVSSNRLFMAENENKNSSWSALGFAWELGYSITIPIVIFALVGRLIDKKLGTSPWMLLVGILVSIMVSSYMVYKKTIKVMK